MTPAPESAGRSNVDLSDPRMDERYLRTVPASDGDGTVVLVGVVHDHPASIARVEAVIDGVDPNAVGLEVPAMAVPYYAAQAATDGPDAGGEISAAIRAAPDAAAVGIDAPDRGFIGRLGRYVHEEAVDAEAARSLVDSVSSVAREAVARRLAATAMAHTAWRPDPARPVDHDCPRDASPAAQAAHEARTIERSRSLLRSVEVPPAVEAFDELRESHMAARVDALRSHPRTVVVLGLEHLDAVARQVA